MTAIRKRGEKERIDIDIFQTVAGQVQIFDDGGMVDQDMGRAAQVEVKTGHDLFGHDCAAYLVTPFQHDDFVAGFG